MPSDSPYVESRVDLFDKLETAELAERLGVSLVTAVGHLHALWHYVRKLGSLDGDISRLGPDELARAARWDGDPGQLQDALLEGEWLDQNGTVHNWVLYYGREGESRAQATERQRRYKERQRGFTDRELWERDSGCCRFCAGKVTLRNMALSLILPLKAGGQWTIDNTVTACLTCARRRNGLLRLGQTIPIMGLLDDAGSKVTRHLATQDDPSSKMTRDLAASKMTRDIAPVYGNGAEPSESSEMTRHLAGSEVTRHFAGITPGLTGAKVNAVMFSPEAEKVNAVAFSKSGDVNAVQFSGSDQKHNSVHFPPDAVEPAQDGQGSKMTRDSAGADAKPPERVNTGTGVLTGDLTGDASSLSPGVQGVESPAAPKKRGGKREPKPERVEAAERLYGLFKTLVNPGARSCPTDKILKRLERFSEDEVALAIRKFSADAWWSTHCDDKPASWFFRSDDQIEKFLIMRVRPKAGAEHAEQPSWLAEIKSTNKSIGASTLTGDDDSHTPPAPSDEPPMIAANSATRDGSDVAF